MFPMNLESKVHEDGLKLKHCHQFFIEKKAIAQILVTAAQIYFTTPVNYWYFIEIGEQPFCLIDFLYIL